MARGQPVTGDIRFCNSRAPGDERSACIVRMSIAMTSPVAHSVVSGENEGSLVIAVEILNQLCDLLNTLIHHLYVVKIFLGVRPIRVARCIKAQQVQEKYQLILPQLGIKLWV